MTWLTQQKKMELTVSKAFCQAFGPKFRSPVLTLQNQTELHMSTAPEQGTERGRSPGHASQLD